MKLINGLLRPGKIIKVLDNGKIKAIVPGLFNTTDDTLIPPIMPFNEMIGGHPNSFSTPITGEEVWVLNLTDNPLQLYWFRKDNHIQNNENLFKESGVEHVEVICNKEIDGKYATLYFSNGLGWILRNDKSMLQISPDGSIQLGMGIAHRNIEIKKDIINIGDGEHPACLGDKVEEILSNICVLLQSLSDVASKSPYTASLSPVLNQAKQINNQISSIKSTHVKLD